jgi:hypothetical protein
MFLFGFHKIGRKWVVIDPNKHEVQRIECASYEKAWNYAIGEISKRTLGSAGFTLTVEAPKAGRLPGWHKRASRRTKA